MVLYRGDGGFGTTLKEALLDSPVERVFVVDNTCGGFGFLRELSPKVVYIDPGANVGFGAGHNLAFRRAVSEGFRYHLLLNPDVSFSPKDIEELVRVMERRPDVGLITPRVFYPDGRIQYHCRLLPTPWHLFRRRFFGENGHDELYELRFTGYERPMEVPFVMGCFWLLRLSVVDELGGFDPRFFLYMEDVDFCRRLYRCARLLFYPEVSVVHEHRRGSYRSGGLLLRHMESAVRYFNKWGWLRDEERDRINAEVLRRLGVEVGDGSEKDG